MSTLEHPTLEHRYATGEGSLQSNTQVDVGLLKGFKLPITPISHQEFLDRTSNREEIDTEAVRDSCQAHLDHGITEDGVYKVKVDRCYCEFEILSVDHSSGTVGKYFNFNAQKCGRSDLLPAGTYRVRQIRGNSQVWEGTARWWNSVNGGSSGDAHGRRESGSGNSQWRVGDRVQILSYKLEGKNCPEASMDVYVVFERNIDLWRSLETVCYCIYILSNIRENTLEHRPMA